jgi:hypothetical protein
VHAEAPADLSQRQVMPKQLLKGAPAPCLKSSPPLGMERTNVRSP